MEQMNSVEFFHMSLAWFDYTEPSTPLHRIQGMQGAYVLVRDSSSTSNHLERTFSNHIIARIVQANISGIDVIE